MKKKINEDKDENEELPKNSLPKYWINESPPERKEKSTFPTYTIDLTQLGIRFIFPLRIESLPGPKKNQNKKINIARTHTHTHNSLQMAIARPIFFYYHFNNKS